MRIYTRWIWSILRAALMIMLIFAGLGNSVYPLRSASAQEVFCSQSHRDVSTPLNDLGAQIYIRMDGQNTGFSGGLYPGGSNMRPAAHETAGVAIARQVTPLSAEGAPDPLDGKIVMISIGMSNTSQEFLTFVRAAENEPRINPKVLLVNGASAGQVAEYWISPDSPNWQAVKDRLAHEGVTPLQVQAAWVKLTRTGGGDFPAKAQQLQLDLKAVVRNLKFHFPNIQLTYLSSRTRSYLIGDGLSPEPAAFETGFAVKWLIEDQINGDAELNYDPRRGAVVAPFLSWGPYIWADGMNPRSDGLVWRQEDLARDCVHPSSNGKQKVASMLMDFFLHDATTRWFLASPVDIFHLYLPWLSHYLPEFPMLLR